MERKDARIAVVGAGAIGGVAAALMKQAGWDPVLVARHPETVARATAGGLRITGVKGTHAVPVRAVAAVTELPEPPNVVFLATKTTDCLDAARDLLPLLRADSAVVSMQNGICEEDLAGVLGPERVIGCVVGWGATRLGRGELEVTSEGEFVIGVLDGRDDPRLEPIRSMLGAVYPTRISANILGELYSKLIINACINSLGVIAGVRLGELLADRRVRRLFIVLMREAIAVADAMDLQVEPSTGGKIDYYRFLEGNGLLHRLKRHLVIRAVGFKYRRVKSSSLQSLERGRRTEIDYLNGYICRKAEACDVPVPVHRAVVEMVHAIEQGRRPASPANVEDLMEQVNYARSR